MSAIAPKPSADVLTERMARVACNVWHGGPVWHRVGTVERNRWRGTIAAVLAALEPEKSA